MNTAGSPPPQRLALSVGLGLCQLVGFGTSLYLLTMLAQPIAAETGWSLASIVGGLTAGLLFAGYLAPRVGLGISAGHGRRILAASSVLFALGLVAIGLSTSLLAYFLGWLVLGAGMACGLYDACFGALGRALGGGARRVISVVALIGGLASTVFWPLSQFLSTVLDWRGACFAFAGLHLVLCLPIYLGLLPEPDGLVVKSNGTPPTLGALEGPKRHAFWLFGAVMVLESALAAMVAVNLVILLGVADVSPGQAAALGALVGPSQLAIRLADTLFGHRFAPIFSLLFSSVAIAAGLLLLALGGFWVGLAMVLYGLGIGLFSITRATYPIFAFGSQAFPAMMGLIARAALVAQAIGPLMASLVASKLGPEALLATLVLIALGKIALCVMLWRPSRKLGQR